MSRRLLAPCGVVLVLGARVLAQPPPAEPVPPHVVAFAEQTHARLIDTLDPPKVLRPHCAAIVAGIRTENASDDPNAPIINALDDRTLCEVVVQWARLMVEFAVAALSSREIDSPVAKSTSEEEEDAETLRALHRFTPSATWSFHRQDGNTLEARFKSERAERLRYFESELNMGLGLDGGVCVASMRFGWPPIGRPSDALETRLASAACFLRMMDEFRGLGALRVEWKTPVLASNVDYVRRHHGGAYAPGGLRSGPSLYTTCRLTWCLGLEDRHGAVQIVAFFLYDP